MKLSELSNLSKNLLDEHGDLDVGVLMLKPWNCSEYSKFPEIKIEYVDESIEEDYEGKPFINLYIDQQ